MSEYKGYLLRQLGIKESQFQKSLVERDSFPGIDPDELEKGSDEEAGEHGMSKEKALQTAKDHLQEPGQKHYYSGMEKAKERGMFKDSVLMSPTAIATPVIGVAIRGSSTGGLPSGADRYGDITPNNFGGYTKIPTDHANSKLIDKTPSNPSISNQSAPIVNNPQTADTVTHPHQIQKDAGQPPQELTGASTDGDDTLKLKSAMPKGIDVDVSEESEEEEKIKSSDGGNNPNKETGMGDGMNTITEGKHKKGCQCGFCKNKGSFGKKKKTEEKSKTEEGKEEEDECMDETFKRHKKLMKESFEKNEYKETGCETPNTQQDVSTPDMKEEKIEEKYSAPFARMRGLANLGERRVSSNGIWSEGVGASEPFTTKWKMDKEKAGMVKVSENGDKWMQNVSKGAEQHGTKGALHKDLGIPEDNKIPDEKLDSVIGALSKKSKMGTLSDKELTLLRRANAARNMRNANK